MAIYGYARVSTEGQNLDRQVIALEEAGCEYIYSEKISGAKDTRPELEQVLNLLGEGDVLIVSELTRVSRSTQDLINIVSRVTEAGASIQSLKDKWLDTTTAQGKLMLTIFAGLAEFERDLLIERTKDGMKAAKARGAAIGRPAVNKSKMEYALELYAAGEKSVPQIVEITGVSKASLYRELKKQNAVKNTSIKTVTNTIEALKGC